jgi:hypothetical protein
MMSRAGVRLRRILKDAVTGYIPDGSGNSVPPRPPPLLNPIKTEAKPEVTEPLKQEESHELSKMRNEKQPEDPLHLASSLDFDVRPRELVDAIVVHTNWESQVDKLVKIIREARRVPDESSTSPSTSLFPSLTGSRAPDESSTSPARAPDESARFKENGKKDS